ncbi:MAG: ABC transporter ATP-binding protein [Opitutales bacterium]
MSGGQTEASLTTTALGIGYEQGAAARCIAKNLNLRLEPGNLVCLLGPNGAGKSTLIRTLAGMQAPIAGRITISAHDFHAIAPRQRAKLVSVVLTETHPVGMMDAQALVSLGRHPYSGWFGSLSQHDRERIDWALHAVGARNLAQRQVAELSDGERQKVSIARALAQESKVMLLDEPTAFLDLPRRVELMTILRDLAHREQLALLLSTHDLDLALRFADRLWLMNEDGQLTQGHPEVIAMSDALATVFESEQLDWDPGIGSFRTHREPCLQASVTGEGDRALWTQRALQRLGFGIVESDASPAFSIRIRTSGWELTRGQISQRFTSLAALIDWVRSENWTDEASPQSGHVPE